MNQDVKAFCDVIISDEALRQKLLLAATGDVEELLESVVKSGAERGYTFTAGEAREFVQQAEELSDEVLDLVSAGAPAHCVTSSVGGQNA